jgi:hypothetical protein
MFRADVFGGSIMPLTRICAAQSIGIEWRLRFKSGREKAVRLEILNLLSTKTLRDLRQPALYS